MRNFTPFFIGTTSSGNKIPIFIYHYQTQEKSEMAQLLKQSTAYTFQLGPFVDSTDGVTPETGLTIAATDVDVSKNGAAYADKNDSTALTGTGDSQGYYDCVLNGTDTGTLGKLEVRCYVSGALPVFRAFQVVPAHVYDGLVAGTDNLQVDTVQLSGTAQTGRDIGASVLLSSGTDAGQISLSGGAVTAGTVSDKTGYSLTATTGLGNQTANITGNLSGSVGSVGTGGITSTSFATDAITAAAIAANAIGASELAADAADEIADALLARNVAGGSSTGRLVKEALYPLRNRVAVSGGTMTVYGVDDSTSSWTAVVTTTEGANPITSINPEGGSA